MDNSLRVRDKPYYPRRTSMMLKRTSLLIDELEIRREQESRFKLTHAEVQSYNQLKTLFRDKQAADKIKGAIDDEKQLKQLRKDFLTASKIQRDCTNAKLSVDADKVELLLLVSGTPTIMIGLVLLDTFITAGVGTILTGVVMCIPSLVKSVTKKRKAKSDLKKINKQVESLSNDIYKKTKNIDNVCSEYGIPINCTERAEHMASLLNAANEFKRLEQKVIDYELLVRLNGTDTISREISNNIQMLSGLTVNDENEYDTIINELFEQFQ